MLHVSRESLEPCHNYAVAFAEEIARSYLVGSFRQYEPAIGERDLSGVVMVDGIQDSRRPDGFAELGGGGRWVSIDDQDLLPVGGGVVSPG